MPISLAIATLAWSINGSAATAAAIKVACIGDQMTHSDLFSNSRETQPVGMQEYPRKLQDLMGAGYDVRNFGDCCASVIGGYVHSETHPYVSGSNYKAAVAFAPDIVIIGPWGRHDWGKSAMTALAAFSVPAFQTGYEDIINKFQALPSKPKIFVSTLVPLPFGMDGPDNGYKTSPQNDVVKALAAKYSLPTIDLFTAFTNQPTLFIQPPNKDSDGEHSSDAGSTKIAMMAQAALTGQSAPPSDAGVVPTADAGSSQSGGRSGGAGGATVASGSGGADPVGASGGAVGSGGLVGSSGGDTLTSTGGAGTGGAGTGGAGTGGAAQIGIPSGSGGAVAGGAPAASDSGSGSSGCSCRIGAIGAGDRAQWGVLGAFGLLGLALARSRSRSKEDSKKDSKKDSN